MNKDLFPPLNRHSDEIMMQCLESTFYTSGTTQSEEFIAELWRRDITKQMFMDWFNNNREG